LYRYLLLWLSKSSEEDNMSKFSKVIVAVMMIMLLTSFAWSAGKQESQESAEVKELAVFSPVHHYMDALKQKFGEFEASSGIKIKLIELPEEEFYKKTTIELSSGKPTFDVFLLNQGFTGQYIGAGWVEQLDPNLNDPNQTSKEYDIKDFPPGAMSRPTFDGKIYGIPATVDPQIYFYRKDIMADSGINAPKTMDEVYNAAVKIDKAYPDVAGIANRLARGAGSFWPWLGFVYDYQGQWIDPDLGVHITDPKTIAATDMYVKLLKDAGPPTALNYGWYEVLSSFQAGKSAMLMDANSWISAFQDKEKSAVVGKVGASVMPAGPDGYIQAAGGCSWMLAITAASQKKEAAWKFIEWATSKKTALYVAVESGNVSRHSTWSEPEFIKKYPYPDWIEASSSTTNDYNNTYYMTTHPKLGALGEIIDISLQNIYMGADVKEELTKAEKATKELLE